jgi:hypothetical protein
MNAMNRQVVRLNMIFDSDGEAAPPRRSRYRQELGALCRINI